MKQTLYPLGKITKTHGYNGTVALVSDRLPDDESENPNEVFVVIDGLFVPFPVEDFELLTDTLAHIKLEFADSQNEALKLTGCDVYSATPPHKQKPKPESEKWLGFTVHDHKFGNAGIIQKIEDYKGNIVMQVIDGKKETLISMYPELITGIDEIAKILYISAPDGYF